jgi:hypothetical protein
MTDKPEGARDDAGRTDDSTGFDIQARMFGGIGAFVFLLATVYWFVSYEPAGTTMLALAGGLATLTAVYIWLNQPASDIDVDQAADPHGEDLDQPWFPHASIWPFAVGAGAVLVANGILLGLWMVLPAGFVLAGAIIGFSRQSRQRA